ncbi:MAG: YggS family pyridoxal phosphate-dependent enzyme [Bacillota bacterium]|jgi:pyridoxal phosphate enzyme (YggS family)
MIEDNLEIVMGEVLDACERAHRDPDSVRLMAVTKNVSSEEISEAYSLGLRLFGENRVQEARTKTEAGVFGDSKICLIGHLQTNKASLAARLFDAVHSVDSTRVVDALSRFSVLYRPKGRGVEVMIEVNVGRDPRKHGVMPEDAYDLAKHTIGLPGVTLTGLMTVPPGMGDLAMARQAFRELRTLRDRLVDLRIDAENLNELSMGMSGDYQVAIEEGATIIRLGTALFGPRAGSRR